MGTPDQKLTVEQELFIALEALAFYADPETYHAITIIGDRPTGGFDEDFSMSDYYGYEKPGKRAREAFLKLQIEFEQFLD